MSEAKFDEILKKLTPAQLAVLRNFLTNSPRAQRAASKTLNPSEAKAKRVAKWKAGFAKLDDFLLASGHVELRNWWNGNGAEFEVTSEAGDIKLTLSNGYAEGEKKELFFRLQAIEKKDS